MAETASLHQSESYGVNIANVLWAEQLKALDPIVMGYSLGLVSLTKERKSFPVQCALAFLFFLSEERFFVFQGYIFSV